MPEFEIISMKEAKLSTTSGRQGKFMNEYAQYIQQLPKGQAGKLHSGESETRSPSDAALFQLRRRWVFPW